MCTNSMTALNGTKLFTKSHLYDMKLDMNYGKPSLAVECNNGATVHLRDSNLDEHFCMSWFGTIERVLDKDCANNCVRVKHVVTKWRHEDE